MRIRVLLLAGILLWVAVAYSDAQRPISGPGPGKVFLFTAKKLGIPILKASISIENVPSIQGKSLYQARAEISSVNLGFLFRINNRFISTFEAETCTPVQYVKEIDQDGLLKERKNYHQTLTFDSQHQKVTVEKKGEEKTGGLPSSGDVRSPLDVCPVLSQGGPAASPGSSNVNL